MRFLLGLVLVVATPAAAFDGQKASEDFYKAVSVCQLGEEYGTPPPSPAEIEKQCKLRYTLMSELKANGYCWDKSEQVWAICK